MRSNLLQFLGNLDDALCLSLFSLALFFDSFLQKIAYNYRIMKNSTSVSAEENVLESYPRGFHDILSRKKKIFQKKNLRKSFTL